MTFRKHLLGVALAAVAVARDRRLRPVRKGTGERGVCRPGRGAYGCASGREWLDHRDGQLFKR